MGSVTIGSDTFNIYGTSAGADTYLAARIGSTWSAQSATTKAQALVSATRAIQTYLAGLGFTVDPSGAVDTEIENATYEYANGLVADAGLIDQANANSNTRRLKAGSAEIEYFRPERGGRFPSAVQALLTAWISGQGGSLSSSPYVSGGCEQSILDGDDFGLSEGF